MARSGLTIGARVRLRSGGPPSLVVDLHDEDHVTIAWRCADGQSIRELKLPAICLTKIHSLKR